jgi:hypothetical protein
MNFIKYEIKWDIQCTIKYVMLDRKMI